MPRAVPRAELRGLPGSQGIPLEGPRQLPGRTPRKRRDRVETITPTPLKQNQCVHNESTFIFAILRNACRRESLFMTERHVGLDAAFRNAAFQKFSRCPRHERDVGSPIS